MKKKRGKKRKSQRESSSDDSAGSASSSSDNDRLKMQIVQLKQECADPRAVLLKRLRRWGKRVRWELPGGFKTRVTVWLMMFLFKAGFTAVENLTRWANSKCFEEHPAIKNLLVTAMTFDQMMIAKEFKGMLNSEAVEVMSRRFWGTVRAFDNVSELAH